MFDLSFADYEDRDFHLVEEWDSGRRLLLSDGCASLVVWKRLIFHKNVDSAVDPLRSNRYLYMHPEDRPLEETPQTLIQKLLSCRKWIILLCHGGYFSGAVFAGKRVVAHKTFHAYVVRKKQGGRQMSRDKSGRRPRSGGAQIRRHNEEKHEKEVKELKEMWRQHFCSADLIFTHLPGFNKDLFVSRSPSADEFFFEKCDSRLRKIPFSTHRPSFAEVKRVFAELSTITISEAKTDQEPSIKPIDHRELQRSLGESGEWNSDRDLSQSIGIEASSDAEDESDGSDSVDEEDEIEEEEEEEIIEEDENGE